LLGARRASFASPPLFSPHHGAKTPRRARDTSHGAGRHSAIASLSPWRKVPLPKSAHSFVEGDAHAPFQFSLRGAAATALVFATCGCSSVSSTIFPEQPA